MALALVVALLVALMTAHAAYVDAMVTVVSGVM